MIATIAAIHDGIMDAQTSRSFFWAVLRRPQERITRLREGLNATARIILLSLAMDVIYQLIVLKTIRHGEAAWSLSGQHMSAGQQFLSIPASCASSATTATYLR